MLAGSGPRGGPANVQFYASIGTVRLVQPRGGPAIGQAYYFPAASLGVITPSSLAS